MTDLIVLLSFSLSFLDFSISRFLDGIKALLEMCFGLGLILGPTVGGALYQFGGYYMPFVILGAFLLLGGIATFLALPTSCESIVILWTSANTSWTHYRSIILLLSLSYFNHLTTHNCLCHS